MYACFTERITDRQKSESEIISEIFETCFFFNQIKKIRMVFLNKYFYENKLSKKISWNFEKSFETPNLKLKKLFQIYYFQKSRN